MGIKKLLEMSMGDIVDWLIEEQDNYKLEPTMSRKKSDEYVEVLSQIISNNVPELKPARANALLEDILNQVGREDYRYLHEALAGEHSKLLDEMEDLLKRIVTALDDAIIITNSDCVNREKIEATAERISRAGGKMKYFTTLIEEIEKTKQASP